MFDLFGVLVGAAVLATASDDHVLRVLGRSQLDGSPPAHANCGPVALSMVLSD